MSEEKSEGLLVRDEDRRERRQNCGKRRVKMTLVNKWEQGNCGKK